MRIHADAKFNRLSSPPPCGKYLWLYLLTGPHTGIIPGLSKAGEAQLSEDLGWPVDGFRLAFAEVMREGLAEADWNARVVWLPNAIVHNPPQAPNSVVSWREQWEEIPECDLKLKAFQRLKAFIEGMHHGFVEAFDQAMGYTRTRTRTGTGQQTLAASCPSEIILTFSTVGPVNEWDLLRGKLGEYEATYPNLDVLSECRKALQWTRDNPSHRKTASGMPRFLGNWMAAATAKNSGSGNGRRSSTPDIRRTAGARDGQKVAGGFDPFPGGVPSDVLAEIQARQRKRPT